MEKQTNRLRTREPFPRSSAKNAKALGSFLSVSKGIDVYIFEDPDFGAQVTASVSTQGTTVTQTLNGFAPVPSTVANAPASPPPNLQVDSSNMGFFDLYDTVTWQAAVGSNSGSLFTGINSININPYTGNCEGAGSDMFNTQSYIVPANTAGNSKAISVCFGFYDASTGEMTGLPSQDQLYLNLATARSTWMTDNSSELSSLTLGNVCLPGAHDAGMCTMQTVYAMLDSIQGAAFYGIMGAVATTLAAACIATVFAPALPLSPAFGAAAAANATNFLCNVSITQKDSIATMLANGIRYFDFRPGYMWWALPSLGGGLYHQHMCIPGYGYVNFLTDILTFCANNPGEIVVIDLCADGFVDTGFMSPSDEDLAVAWWAACQAATGPNGTGVYNIAPAGGASALTTTFADLLTGQFNTNQNVDTDTGASCGTDITSNQVVFLYQMPNATGPTYPTNPATTFDFTATKDDSYSDSLYSTTDPTPIRNNFAVMAAATLTNDYTVLQCQGTPTLQFGVLTNAAFTYSDAGSPLLAIKPAFDNCNLGWIISNTKSFTGQMLVLLNDFADNATVATAIMWNRQNIKNFM